MRWKDGGGRGLGCSKPWGGNATRVHWVWMDEDVHSLLSRLCLFSHVLDHLQYPLVFTRLTPHSSRIIGVSFPTCITSSACDGSHAPFGCCGSCVTPFKHVLVLALSFAMILAVIYEAHLANSRHDTYIKPRRSQDSVVVNGVLVSLTVNELDKPLSW
jgi:hypothetical protein